MIAAHAQSVDSNAVSTDQALTPAILGPIHSDPIRSDPTDSIGELGGACAFSRSVNFWAWNYWEEEQLRRRLVSRFAYEIVYLPGACVANLVGVLPNLANSAELRLPNLVPLHPALMNHLLLVI